MKIRQHRDDQTTYELYTVDLLPSGKASVIIWAVIHEDGLERLGLTPEDIENFDYKLEGKPDYPPARKHSHVASGSLGFGVKR